LRADHSLTPSFYHMLSSFNTVSPSTLFFISHLSTHHNKTLLTYTTLFRTTHKIVQSIIHSIPNYQKLLKQHPELPFAYEKLLQKDRKSTRLNSSHVSISYAVFCLKKKNFTNRYSPSTRGKSEQAIASEH